MCTRRTPVILSLLFSDLKGQRGQGDGGQRHAEKVAAIHSAILSPCWREGTRSAVFALADDLTGALEIGAKFAAAGISSAVTTQLRWESDATALVIDTETRHLQHRPKLQQSSTPACARGSRLSASLQEDGLHLRGNIGAELSALAAAFPGARVVYVPAYPRMGRTVSERHPATSMACRSTSPNSPAIR